MTLQRFSMLALEKKLSALPWILTFACWMLIAGVLLFLYILKPTEETASVMFWLVPLSFLAMVPGLGGFVCLMMRSRRSRLDTRLLSEAQALLGGTLHGPSLLRPVIRPRLLAERAGVPVEIILSPPIPRTTAQTAVDFQRAAAKLMIDQAERALESPDARLGTETLPQLELRVGVDLPFKLHVGTRGPELSVTPGLTEVPVEDPAFSDRFRALSDAPEAAARLLASPDLRARLVAATGFNHPWATQLTLRPAHSGRGAGIYLLSVAASDTSADSLVTMLGQLLEVARHPAWCS